MLSQHYTTTVKPVEKQESWSVELLVSPQVGNRFDELKVASILPHLFQVSAGEIDRYPLTFPETICVRSGDPTH